MANGATGTDYQLKDPLTEVESRLVSQRESDASQAGQKYQDINKRVAHVLGLFSENRRLTEAIAADPSSGGLSNEKLITNLRRAADISTNGQYTQWLTTRYSNGDFQLSELGRVRDAIAGYVTHRTSLPIQDLLRYTSLAHLETAVLAQQSAPKAESKKALAKKQKAEGAFVVYDGDDGKVIGLKNYDASKLYSAGTRWCTSMASHFDNYFGSDELFVFIAKSGGKYQLHEKTMQFMDKDDLYVWPKLQANKPGASNETDAADFQFIKRAIPFTFCARACEKLGVATLPEPDPDSDNPKELVYLLERKSEVSAAQLESMARSHRFDLVLQALRHPSASEDTLINAISKQDDVSILCRFTEQIDGLTDKALELLIKKGNHNLSLSALNHQNAGVKATIAAYMNEGDLVLRRVAVQKSFAPTKMLEHAAKNETDPVLLGHVAANNNLSLDALQTLLLSTDSYVKRSALRNHKVTTSQLIDAYNEDSSVAVAKIIISHPSSTPALVSKAFFRSPTSFKVEIACKSEVTPAVRFAIVNENISDVHLAFVTKGPVTSEDISQIWARSDDFVVQAACLKSPACPIDIVKNQIETLDRRNLKHFAAQNPQLDLSYLAQIASNHKSVIVRDAARKNFTERGGDESLLKVAVKHRKVYM